MSLIAGALRLGAVLNHLKAVFARDRDKRVEIYALAEKMDWHNGRRARRDSSLQLLDVHQQVVRPNVDKHRPCAERTDGRDRRDRSIGNGDHLVASLHTGSRECDIDCVGAAVYADGARYADIGGHFALKLDALLSENQPAGAEHAIDGREDLLVQLIVFSQVVPHID